VEGSVAMLAPVLAIRDDKIDVYIDSYGPIDYLDNDAKKIGYIKEVVRVLKVGGIAYFFMCPIEFFQEIEEFIDLEEQGSTAIKIKKIKAL
jgi:SAM-dependent methyltransferase